MIQFYVYVLFRFFSVVIYYKIWDVVPCATQEDLAVYLLYI